MDDVGLVDGGCAGANVLHEALAHAAVQVAVLPSESGQRHDAELHDEHCAESNRIPESVEKPHDVPLAGEHSQRLDFHRHVIALGCVPGPDPLGRQSGARDR